MNILLVEDNKRISEFVVKGLEECGFSVTLAETGTDARVLLPEQRWSVILMDIMLPDIDGIELVQYARFKEIHTPILVLSALNDLDDRVKALDCGADDYLPKPFHFKELLARINALARRGGARYETNCIQCEDISLYPDSHVVKKADKEIKLTLQEFKLLKFLMENKNRVLSRTEILDTIWGIDFDTNTNVVDVYISYLRNKIDDGNSKKIIETVKGVGYIVRS